MHLKLGQLRWRPVMDANAEMIGRVWAPLVDTETWLVDTLRVAVRRRAAGALGMVWSFFKRPMLDVPTGLIHAAGDAIILRVSMAELRESPPVPVEEMAAAVH
jgi:sporulation protein YlmC with PRC-barrel domain